MKVVFYEGKVHCESAAYGSKNVSGEAIWAAAQWLEAHDSGGPYEIFRNRNGRGGGYRLTVEKLA